MLKNLIEQAKNKALKDDNKYWERQEEWIQRKNITWHDVGFGQYMLMWSLAGLSWTIIFYGIF